MKKDKMMEYVLEDDVARKAELRERLEKRGDSAALIAQNIICVLYGVIMLVIGFSGFIYVSGFWDLIFKLCIIPAVLMPAAQNGVFRKFSEDTFGSPAYNKSLTAFVYHSTAILMPITMFFPIAERLLEESFYLKNTIIIVCLVTVLANFVFSRMKSYDPDEARYINLLQGFGWIRLLACVGFYIMSAYLFAGALFALNTDSEAAQMIMDIIFIAGVISILFYSHENMARLACICGRKYNRYRNMIWSVVNFALIVIPILYKIFADISDFEWWMFLILTGNYDLDLWQVWSIIACPLVIMVFEIAFFMIDRQKNANIFDEDREEIESGKAYGIPAVKVSFDSLRIKSWNYGIVLFIFLLFRILKEGLRYGAGVLWAVSSWGDATAEGEGSTVLLSVMTVGGYLLLFVLMFVFTALNGDEYKETDVYITETVKPRWLNITFLSVTGAFAVVPLLIGLICIFNIQGQTFLDLVFGNMLIYAYLGSYLLKKVRAGAVCKLILPCAVFLVIETGLFVLEYYLAEIGFIGIGYSFAEASGSEALVGAIIVFALLVGLPIVIGMLIYNATQRLSIAVFSTYILLNMYYYITQAFSPLNAVIVTVTFAVSAVMFVFWGIVSVITSMKRKKIDGQL